MDNILKAYKELIWDYLILSAQGQKNTYIEPSLPTNLYGVTLQKKRETDNEKNW